MNQKIEVYEQKPDGFSPHVEISAIYVNVCKKLLLLNLSRHKVEAGAWGVPAGKLEVGETAIHAAKRELFEETGIDIPSEHSLQSYGKLYICKPEVHYIYHLFELILKDFPSIQLSDEHLSYKWVSKEEADHLPLMKGGKEALDFYYKQGPCVHCA